MSLFKKSTYDTAANVGAQFVPFAENMYEAEIVTVEIKEQEATDWSGGHPVKTGEMEDCVEVTFFLSKPIDGDKLLDINGKESEFMNMKFWFHPAKTGIGKKGPSKARQFLCAALNLKPDVKIDLAFLEDVIVEKKLINKPIKLYISAASNTEGVVRNKIERFVEFKEKK